MKRIWLVVVVMLLCGCSGESGEMQRCLKFRENLLASRGCSFTAEITADFGDKTYAFALDCHGNEDGSLSFCVDQPDSISGIRGTLSAVGGKITFDEDRAIAFPMLAEGEVSPVSAPWLLYNTLRSGYISACGMEGERLRITLNDSYEEESLQVDVWLDSNNRPEFAEILWQGRRVLSISVSNYQIL